MLDFALLLNESDCRHSPYLRCKLLLINVDDDDVLLFMSDFSSIIAVILLGGR